MTSLDGDLNFKSSRIVISRYETIPDDQLFEWFNNAISAHELIKSFLDSPPTTNLPNDVMKALKSFCERVLVLKYFREHICASGLVEYSCCNDLWEDLKGDVDFKKIDTLKKTMNFIEFFAKLVLEEFSENAVTCPGCKRKEFDRLHRVESCNNCSICETCVDESRVHDKCAQCTRTLNGNEKFDEIGKPNPNNKKLKKFKSSINDFFMAIVQNLCFNPSYKTFPDDDVIKEIIKCLMPFQTDQAERVLDLRLSPSIKSTLFQFLFNYSQSNLETHLNMIFSSSADYLRQKYMIKDLTNLKVMYINSLEDYLHTKHNRGSNISFENLFQMLKDIEKSLASLDKTVEPIEIQRLQIVAKIRYCMVSFTEVISKTANFDKKPEYKKNEYELTKMIQDLVQSNSARLRLLYFIIKNIYRKRGQSVFKNLTQIDQFKWIIPNDDISEPHGESSDCFLLCGDQYSKVNKSLKDVLATQDFSKFTNEIQPNRASVVYTFLALFNNVNLFQSCEQSDMLKNLIDETKKRVTEEHQSLFYILLDVDKTNKIINNKQNWQISMLLIHFYAFIKTVPELSLFGFFKQIVDNPENFVKAFLPSMPHDDVFEVYTQFKKLEGKSQFIIRPLDLYQCPNGHLYTIGNCTRPMETSVCPTCKKTIGGKDHKLSDGNEKIEELNNKNEIGYIPQLADMNNNQKTEKINSIRNMGQLNTGLIRLFLECALYLASLNKPDQVVHIVHSQNPIDSESITQFFYNQIVSTTQELADYIQELSVDDCLLLVHFALFKINSEPNRSPEWGTGLPTKDDREKFEKEFCTFVSEKIVGNNTVGNLINQFTTTIKNEAKINGSDKFFKIAYDLIEPEPHILHNESTLNFLDEAAFWNFRKQITIKSFIDNFKNFFQNQTEDQQKGYRLLDKFLDQLDHLKTIKHLPRILKSVKFLHMTLNRQLDKQTAKNLTLAELIEDPRLVHNRGEILAGAKSFKKLWSKLNQTMRQKLSSKIVTKFSQQPNIDEKHDDILMVPISYLLPARFGDGIYIFALIVFLADAHNEFINFYNGIKSTKSHKIDVNQINESTIINVSAKGDILNTIYLNSNYSLEHVKEVKLEFKYDKIQDSMDSKLFSSKPTIDVSNIPMVEFTDSINDLSRFEILGKLIEQMELSFTQKEKISKFYETPESLKDVIRQIHICIDFVISSGFSRPDMKIMAYAKDVLKMSLNDDSDLNQQINQLEVTYLESVWNLLSLRRAILLTEHGQDPFDQLGESFRKTIELPQNTDSVGHDNFVTEYVRNKKTYPNLENLLNLLSFLYQFIVYKLIPLSQNLNDDQMFNPENDIEPFLSSELVEMLGSSLKFELDEFNLNNIRLKNIYELWKCFVKIFLDIKK